VILGIEVDSYQSLSDDIFREVVNFTTNMFFIRWGGIGLTALFENPISWAVVWLTGWCWLTNSYISGVLRGTFIGSILLLFFGLDTAVLPALATFPWIMSVFRDKPYKLLICVASSTVNCALGLGLSLASYLLAVVTEIIRTRSLISFCEESRFTNNINHTTSATHISDKIKEKVSTNNNNSLNQRYFSIGLLIHCTALLAVPYPTDLQFPNQAKVVPDDGVSGMVRPLLGKGSPIPYLDNETIKERFRFWIILSLMIVNARILVTLPSTVNYFSKIRPFLPKFSSVTFIYLTFTSLLLTLVTADLFLPSNLGEIAPLATIRRIIPHLFFYSLSPLCFGVAIIVFLSPLITPLTTTSMLWANTVTTLLLALSPSPLLHRIGSEKAFKKDDAAYKIVSPGYAVVRRLIDCTGKSELARTSSLKEITPPISQIISGGGNDKISALQDGNLNSRWTYGEGKQLGKEWLKLTLVEPTLLSGIRLNTGSFTTDFARSIQITECDNPTTILYKSCDWLGPAYLTKNSIPFFGSQSDTTYVFLQPTVVQCLKIEQLGVTNKFDWSITEIQFIKKVP
jgi:hypothetical protein